MNALDFGYDWKPREIEIDLNDLSVRAHLKALFNGFGSTTENILIDFVTEEWKTISQYKNVQEAWSKLDREQRNMVAGFRSFLGLPFICDVHSPHYPSVWFRRIVHTEYENFLGLLPSNEAFTLDQFEQIARNSEETIRSQLVSTDLTPAWIRYEGEA